MVVCRFFSLLIILFLFVYSLSSQDSRSFLKTEPFITEDTPAWAIEMYELTPDVLKVDSEYQKWLTDGKFKKSIHTQNYKHWRRNIEPYLTASGGLDIPSEKEQYKSQQKLLNKKRNSNKRSGDWKPLGPLQTYSTNPNQTKVSWQANVYTIDQSKSDPSILYVGTEAGGIFKSTDKGENWNMVSQNTSMKTISSIKVDPIDPEIVYAGQGGQIYKSTNGGASWELTFLQNNFNINDIAINPANTDILLAGGSGGLYRSTDSGDNWNQIDASTIWDIEINVFDASQVYILKSNESKIRTEFWKSTDGGQTFRLKDNGWYDSSDNARINAGGRMTVTEADANRIYVILIGASKANDNGYIGVYRSENGGENWTLTDPPIGGPYTSDHPNLATLNNTNTLQQGYYNLSIAASDEDADIFLVGCLNLWRSDNGGKNFTPLGGYQGSVNWIHPDQQEIEINGNDMWVVNDGGINYSQDYFSSHESKVDGLNASDYWGLGSGWNEDLLVGGRYHNGNSAHRPSFGEGNYLRLGGGEAPTGYVSPGEQGVTYYSDISGKLIPDSLHQEVIDIPSLSVYPSESFYSSHYSELEYHPNCYNHLWLGRENKLYFSDDGGNTFDLIQEFGDVEDPIMQFEISRVDPDVIYVYQRIAFYEAIIWVSLDGGASWERKALPDAQSQRAGALQIDSQDPASLWLSFGHQNNDGNKIFKTSDHGSTWENITDSTLDGETVSCLFHQAGTSNLYLGTDYSIYVYNGVSWRVFSDNLPLRFTTNRMLPFYKENKLRVASYGNGIWETEMPDATPPLAQATVDKLSTSCSRDTFYFDDYSTLTHDTQTSWEWTFDPQPRYVSSSSARNPKVVFGAVGNYSVALTVKNANGQDTYEMNNMISVESDNCQPSIYPDNSLLCRQQGDDYVQLDNINLNSESYTLTAWIKSYGDQNDYTGIIFNDDKSFGLNFSTENQLGFHHHNVGVLAWSWNSDLRVVNDVWTYVALVVDSDKARVYLNGDYSEIELDLWPVELGSMKIGSYKGWAGRNFNGEIDEVTIWNRALSTDEIRTHRHITKDATNADGLIAYYQFGDSDRTILDRIGHNHGTMRGGTVLLTSSTPVGGGTASSWNNHLDDAHEFLSEDISLSGNITEGSSITASKINIQAQNLNIEDAFPVDSYWIVNSYGNTQIEEVRFLNTAIESEYENKLELVGLYSRNENDSTVDFEYRNEATSIDSGQDSEIIFNVQDIDSDQLILEKKLLSSIDDVQERNYKLYPNPTEGIINLETTETGRFILFSEQGMKILEKEYQDGIVETIRTTFPSGNYKYLLVGKNKMRSGTLIIMKE